MASWLRDSPRRSPGAPTSYEVETVRWLAVLMQRLQAVVNSEVTQPGPEQPLLPARAVVDELSRARVHHLVLKARASHIGALVKAQLTDDVKRLATVVTGMSYGVTLVDGFPQKPAGSGRPNRTDDRFQWQIQGNDLRLAAVFPSLAGRTTADRKAREEAAERFPDWFDFAPAREFLGERCGTESTSWLRFDPDFVYRKVTIKHATVREVVELGRRYSERLAAAPPPSQTAEGT